MSLGTSYPHWNRVLSLLYSSITRVEPPEHSEPSLHILDIFIKSSKPPTFSIICDLKLQIAKPWKIPSSQDAISFSVLSFTTPCPVLSITISAVTFTKQSEGHLSQSVFVARTSKSSFWDPFLLQFLDISSQYIHHLNRFQHFKSLPAEIWFCMHTWWAHSISHSKWHPAFLGL